MTDKPNDPAERPDADERDDPVVAADDDLAEGAARSTEPAAEAELADSGAAAFASNDATDEITQADVDALMAQALGAAEEAPSDDESASPAPTSAAKRPGRVVDAAAGRSEGKPEDPGTDAGEGVATQPFEYAELDPSAERTIDAKRVTMLNDVNLRVKLQLGETRMLVEEVLKLGEGSVVELDKLAGDPVDVVVNDRLVARGEVLVLNDSFCVRISEVLSHDPHRVTT